MSRGDVPCCYRPRRSPEGPLAASYRGRTEAWRERGLMVRGGGDGEGG